MFLKILFLISIQALFSKNSSCEIKDSRQPAKKRKNIDIDTLREDFIVQLTSLLKKLEITLTKVNKKNVEQITPMLVNILHWINDEISLFMKDPTEFDRQKLRISLNKVLEYDNILNDINKM
jgi:hypothetical protein